MTAARTGGRAVTDAARDAVTGFLARYRHLPGLVAVAVGTAADADAGGRREAILVHADPGAVPSLRASLPRRWRGFPVRVVGLGGPT
jgi:hypothetical protein